MIATKVGQYKDKQFDFSAARVEWSVAESLARLQTDYLDLVQCHDVEFGSLDQVRSIAVGGGEVETKNSGAVVVVCSLGWC